MKKLISLLLVLTIGIFANQAFGQQTNKQKEDKGKKTEMKAAGTEKQKDTLKLKEGQKPPVKEGEMKQGQKPQKEGKVSKGKKVSKKQGSSTMTKKEGEKSNKGKATGKDNYGQEVKATNMEKKDTLKKSIDKPVKEKEVKK